MDPSLDGIDIGSTTCAITITGKFYHHDESCSYSEWDCIPFDECDNDDDNMFNALLCAHQIISNGDAKWVSIGHGPMDSFDIVDYPHDVLNHMVFFNMPQPIDDGDWHAIPLDEIPF